MSGCIDLGGRARASGGTYRMRTKLIAAFLAFIGFAATAAAQGVTGTVSGTVKDAQGAVIPGATISLISESRGTTIAHRRLECQRRLRRSERHG